MIAVVVVHMQISQKIVEYCRSTVSTFDICTIQMTHFFIINIYVSVCFYMYDSMNN